MEAELRKLMLDTADAYATVAGCSLSAVAKRCRSENNFFQRVAKMQGSFTVRTFDETMIWFATNWPEHADLPAHLRRYLKLSTEQSAA